METFDLNDSKEQRFSPALFFLKRHTGYISNSLSL